MKKLTQFSCLKAALLGLALVLGIGAVVGWYKFFREEPQPAWVNETPEMRFKYGSIGAEFDAGIPYWIFIELPKIFPDLLPGPGGYASLGVPWEQGQELPVAFSGLGLQKYSAADKDFINSGPGNKRDVVFLDSTVNADDKVIGHPAQLIDFIQNFG